MHLSCLGWCTNSSRIWIIPLAPREIFRRTFTVFPSLLPISTRFCARLEILLCSWISVHGEGRLPRIFNLSKIVPKQRREFGIKGNFSCIDQFSRPQGGRHTVMRWTHRTRLQVIRNTPIPDTNLLVDAGWEGFIVIEAEGTNEGLADLQLRCGMEWFKPQPGVQPKQGDGGRVFRLMRERR